MTDSLFNEDRPGSTVLSGRSVIYISVIYIVECRSEYRGEEADERFEGALEARTALPVGEGDFAAVGEVGEEDVAHTGVEGRVVDYEVTFEVVFEAAEVEVG